MSLRMISIDPDTGEVSLTDDVMNAPMDGPTHAVQRITLALLTPPGSMIDEPEYGQAGRVSRAELEDFCSRHVARERERALDPWRLSKLSIMEYTPSGQRKLTVRFGLSFANGRDQSVSLNLPS